MTLAARRSAQISWLILVASAVPVGATPNVSLDDPVYVQLEQLRALGRLPSYFGGARPLTESYIQQLLTNAGTPAATALPAPDVTDWWLRPISSLTARVSLIHDHVRPYSTEIRPAQIAGAVATSCEYEEGRPCGPGAGLGLEVDSSAGYAQWASAFVRLRFNAGNHDYEPAVDVDRAYVNLELGHVALELGRDVQVLGPGSRGTMMLSEHAAPLDHVRISTSRPLELLGERGSIARLSLRYFVARLRDPQQFEGTLLTGSRAQIDLFDSLELGGTRLLQLGGEGAPRVTPWTFLLEHFQRQEGTNGAGISNNRLSFDASYSIRQLRGLRAYYEIAFEDIWYSPDQLFGLEVPALTASGRHGLVIEHQRTGVISHEHSIFTTGMTNAGRTLGSPLGPDAWSLYAAVRIDLPQATLWPWLEWGRFSGNRYDFVEQGTRVRLAAEGPTERRIRAGLKGLLRAGPHTQAEVQGFVERVGTAAFMPDSSWTNVGATAAVNWTM